MASFREHYDNSLDEAAFSEKNLGKVADLMAKIMGKEMGGKFYLLGSETFKNKVHGQGQGVRYINKKNVQIRFNWTKRAQKKHSFDIDSIDYWDGGNVSYKPTLSIKIAPQTNIVQVIARVIKAFKLRKVGPVPLKESLEEASVADSKRSEAQRGAWLKSKGMPVSYAGSEAKTRKAAAKKGLLNDLEAFLGGDDISSFDEEIKDAEVKLDKLKYADPNVIFKDIEALTRATAVGLQNSLIVAGDPGTGKTWHSESILKSMLGSPKGADAKWRFISGNVSPTKLYEILFFNKDDKVIMFDDCDAVWKNEDTVNMMKAALGSDDVRNVGWASTLTVPVQALASNAIEELENKLFATYATNPTALHKGNNRLPSEFDFKSRIVFTSNKSADFFRTLGDGAIMSRSTFVDVHLRKKDLLNRIRTILVAKGETPDDIEEAIEAFENQTENQILSIRGIMKAIKFKNAGIPDWARLAEEYFG